MAVTAKKIGTMEYLTADGISVPHAFTTRHGGVSTGVLASLNLGMHRGDDPENVREETGKRNHDLFCRSYDVHQSVCVEFFYHFSDAGSSLYQPFCFLCAEEGR